MTYICLIAGIILIIIAIRTLFKNFIINFNASDNGFINVLLVGLILASFILSICSFYYVAGFLIVASNGSVTSVEENFPLERNKMIAYVFIGYVSFITCMQILKKIHVTRSKKTNDSNGKWDLKKF